MGAGTPLVGLTGGSGGLSGTPGVGTPSTGPSGGAGVGVLQESWAVPGQAGVCYGWVTDLRERMRETGNDSRVLLLQYEVRLPEEEGVGVGDASEGGNGAERGAAQGGGEGGEGGGVGARREARREAWRGEESIQGGLLASQRLSMALTFWGHHGPWGRSDPAGPHPQGNTEGTPGGAGGAAGTPGADQGEEGLLEDLGRVESLRRTAAEQQEIGPLMAMVRVLAELSCTALHCTDLCCIVSFECHVVCYVLYFVCTLVHSAVVAILCLPLCFVFCLTA